MSLQQALTRKVPLRTSAAWESFAELVTLRVGYGRITITPDQYDKERFFFFLLDHPVTGLSVKRNGEAYSNIEFHNQADETGRAISLLELGEELASDESLTVELLGRRHPDDGRLLENPADILYDLLVNVAGYSIDEERLLDFKAECNAQSHPIKIAGVVDNHQPTLRSTIAEIMQSVGAMWALSVPTLARLFPVSEISSNEIVYGYFSGSPDGVGVLDSRGYSAQYDESEIQTQLQISYDYDWSENLHRQSVLLSADRQTIDDEGERPVDIDARWLQSGALADQLGERVLPYLARPRWRVSFDAGYGGVVNSQDIPVGGIIDVTHPSSPLTSSHVVQRKTVERATLNTTLTIEGAVGRVPDIEIVQRSAQFANAESEFYFQRENDTAVINTNAGATVSLNGRTVIADNNGRAFFPDTPPGTYELVITLSGFDSIGPIEVKIP